MKSQHILLLAAGIVACTAAHPALSEELPARIGTCAAVGDREQRLACYDALADELRPSGRSAAVTAPSLAAAPSPAAAPAKPASPTETFGMEGRAAQATVSEAPSSVVAHVAALQPLPGGRLIIELDNGQVWERVTQGPSLLLEIGDPVTIQRAAIGSFRLVTEASRAARVRRIR